MNFFRKTVLLIAMAGSGLLSVPVRADSLFQGHTFPYFGRLPSTYESETSVSLEVSFYETVSGNDVLSRVPRIYKDHPVKAGGFTLVIEMDHLEYDAVFQNPRRPAFIQIKDIKKNVTFRRQAFLPASESVRTEKQELPPVAASFTDQARAACIATNTAGAKFILEIRNTDVNCQNACVHSEAKSSCVRGWTVFADGNYFEFGDECSKAMSGFSTPVIARICCCLTTSRPMPAQLESLHH